MPIIYISHSYTNDNLSRDERVLYLLHSRDTRLARQINGLMPENRPNIASWNVEDIMRIEKHLAERKIVCVSDSFARSKKAKDLIKELETKYGKV